MVTGSSEVFINQAVTADGDILSANKSLPAGSKNLILLTKVSDFTDGSYVLEIEHSPDGVNFASYGVVPAQAADGISYLEIDDSAFHIFRAKLTSSGVTVGASVQCSVQFTPNRL
jgi:hypothetical protein